LCSSLWLKESKIIVPKFCFSLNLGKTKTFDFSQSRLELTLFYFSILLEFSKWDYFAKKTSFFLFFSSNFLPQKTKNLPPKNLLGGVRLMWAYVFNPQKKFTWIYVQMNNIMTFTLFQIVFKYGGSNQTFFIHIIFHQKFLSWNSKERCQTCDFILSILFIFIFFTMYGVLWIFEVLTPFLYFW